MKKDIADCVLVTPRFVKLCKFRETRDGKRRCLSPRIIATKWRTPAQMERDRCTSNDSSEFRGFRLSIMLLSRFDRYFTARTAAGFAYIFLAPELSSVKIVRISYDGYVLSREPTHFTERSMQSPRETCWTESHVFVIKWRGSATRCASLNRNVDDTKKWTHPEYRMEAF